ncbi:MAG: alpha/beta hydrolase [Candidatus Izemoplasmataceae bacterium]
MRCFEHTMRLTPLSRDAVITVCVPEEYTDEHRQYPVLYMNDGQNIVNPSRAYDGVTWGVKESFETIPNLPEVIVVGIDSAPGKDRLDEYGPFPFTFEKESFEEKDEKVPGGKAEAYIQAIESIVKPFVDATYPTDPSPDATGIMGSSMGGVIALYATVAHGDVFTRAASLSGAFFVSMEAFSELLKDADLSHINKVYLDTGDREEAGGTQSDYLASNHGVHALLEKDLDPEKLRWRIIKGGHHHERDWSRRFPDVIRFLYSD